MVLYFLFISRDWFALFLFQTTLGVAAICFVLVYCPESPKWLISVGQKDKAIKVYNFIAKQNQRNYFQVDLSKKFTDVKSKK